MAIENFGVFIVIWGIVILVKESSLENSTRNNSLSDNDRVQIEENSNSPTRFERTEDL